jgi:hypothetical protein
MYLKNIDCAINFRICLPRARAYIRAPRGGFAWQRPESRAPAKKRFVQYIKLAIELQVGFVENIEAAISGDQRRPAATSGGRRAPQAGYRGDAAARAARNRNRAPCAGGRGLRPQCRVRRRIVLISGFSCQF